MYFPDHALIGNAAKIPTNEAKPVVSFSPVVLPSSDRHGIDLQLRVSAPVTGDALPIILLSHGHGRSNYLSSLEGYGPLADFWAGHGFAVLQPTHLSSRSLSVDAPQRVTFLESRARDMTQILDQLDAVEDAVPLLKGRLDRTKVAVAGHSLGGMTASMVLGATNTDPQDGTKTALGDPRVTAGVILGGTGAAGEDISDAGHNLVPFYGPDFGGMRAPALIVWGDEDVSPHLTVRGADWHADPYRLAPGPKDSLLVRGCKHTFGGISGWDAAETQEDKERCPEMLALMQRMTLAYLRSQLGVDAEAWTEACKALEGVSELGEVERK